MVFFFALLTLIVIIDFYVNVNKNHINVHYFNGDFYVNIHKNHINVHRFN